MYNRGIAFRQFFVINCNIIRGEYGDTMCTRMINQQQCIRWRGLADENIAYVRTYLRRAYLTDPGKTSLRV
jgi:hypothetical protein